VRSVAPEWPKFTTKIQRELGSLLTLVEFGLALAAILVAASLFTNAVEILGAQLGLQQGAVGSVLAAVGTALPETIIPIVAILESVFTGKEPGRAAEIGTGAILGAPFMLVTLALFVIGVSVLAFRRRRTYGTGVHVDEGTVGWDAGFFHRHKAHETEVRIDETTIGRDVGFFLIFFTIAAGAGVVELSFPSRVVIAVLLVVAYAYYVRLTLASGGKLEEVPGRLTLWRFPSRPPLWAVVAQALLALGMIVGGAHLFVDAVKHAAVAMGLPAGLISLVLAPLATELPEKFNSIFWVKDGKDTLALGNVTGAMVFQSTIPVSAGVLFMPWDLAPFDLLAVVLALVSGAYFYAILRHPVQLRATHLLVCGVFYLIYLVVAVFAVV
jgi:cation:H+ antiporter